MKKQKNIIEAPFGETKVLLHTCCAPCSSAIIEALMNNGITPVIYYCNPNIFPREEYEIRKDECTRYAEALGLEIIDADYDHDNWLETMKGLEAEPERGGRCLKCFKLRLLRTAEYARDHGFKVIATTLASSRWKSLDQINEAGFWACDQVTNRYLSTETSVSVDNPHVSCRFSTETPVSVDNPHVSCRLSTETPVSVDKTNDGPVWWPYNWKKGGLQERRLQIIREYDFYNQQYCGCEFSMRNKD